MKPNVKSSYFIVSIICFVLYFGVLLFLRSYVTHNLTAGTSTVLLTPLTVAGWGLVGLGCSYWYASSHPKVSLGKRVAIFFLSPFALSPILTVLQVTFVLLPIYAIAGRM